MGGQAVLAGLRASGEEFPIEASISQYHEGDEVRFTVILRDVTERTRAQERLAASEARMRGILDSAMDAIITVDGEQRVVLFNAAAEAMFGYRREEALGMPLETFLPDRFRSVHAEHRAAIRRRRDTLSANGRTHVWLPAFVATAKSFPSTPRSRHLTDGDTRYFTVILRDVSARVRAIEALRRSKEELQELGAAAQETRELEKSRVARELHDELGQSLTMLRMDVAWCRAQPRRRRRGYSQPSSSGWKALLKTTVAATRRIASDLRPLMLDDLGLVPALEWLVQNMSQRAGIACDFTIDDPGLVLPPAHSTAVFRIVQEALTNIAKHAGATRAEVAVRQHEEFVRVTIHDDGVGFAMDDPRKPSSFGLLGLRERATLLRGTATIRSEPGAGTAIAIELPLPGRKPS
jgi:PAS domain S-box-containing protein